MLVCAGLFVPVGASSSADANQRALFDSQHELGLAFRPIDRAPDAPQSAAPPDIVRRLSESGLFDAKVRAWLLTLAASEDRFEAAARRLQAEALLDVSRAGNRLNDISGTSGDMTLALVNAYGDVLTDARLWITTEASLSSFFQGYGLVIHGAVRAYEQFIARARKHPYPSQDALIAAAQRALDLWDRELQTWTQRGQDLRARDERLVRQLNSAEQRLRTVLTREPEARLARQFAARDPNGNFARLLH